MRKALRWATLLGVAVGALLLQLIQVSDPTAKSQLTELQEQTVLIRELLQIQRQLLDISQDNVAINRRIAELENRLALLERGSESSEVETQLAELRQREQSNDQARTDLERRLTAIEDELRQLGVDPDEYVAENPADRLPTVPATTSPNVTPTPAPPPSITEAVMTTPLPITSTPLPITATPTPISPTPDAPAAGTTRVAPVDGMVVAYVPAGGFLLGSAEGDGEAAPYEKSRYETVFLDGFWIDRTEITNRMFAAFTSQTGYKTDAERAASDTYRYVVTDDQYGVSASQVNWMHPHGQTSDIAGLDDHPVAVVSWNDATAYCAWAGRRLPTAAEWEAAARGVDGRRFPWGNMAPSGNLVNFADSSISIAGLDWADTSTDDGYRFTSPVGAFPDGSSPYGVLDLAGNVSEWVADWFDVPNAGQGRLTKGGHFGSEARWLRSAAINWANADAANDLDGFRCASSVTP